MIITTGRLAWKKLDLNQKVKVPVVPIMTPNGCDNYVLYQEYMDDKEMELFWEMVDMYEDAVAKESRMLKDLKKSMSMKSVPEIVEETVQEVVQKEKPKPKRKTKNVRSNKAKKKTEKE